MRDVDEVRVGNNAGIGRAAGFHDVLLVRVTHGETVRPEDLERRAWDGLMEKAATDNVQELSDFREVRSGRVRIGDAWLRFTEFSVMAVRPHDA